MPSTTTKFTSLVYVCYMFRSLRTIIRHYMQYCVFNPLNAKLNPICHLLALLGAHHILHVSGVSVNAWGWSVMTKTCSIFGKKNKICYA